MISTEVDNRSECIEQKHTISYSDSHNSPVYITKRPLPAMRQRVIKDPLLVTPRMHALKKNDSPPIPRDPSHVHPFYSDHQPLVYR